MKTSNQVRSRSEAGRREMRKHMLGTITALLAIVLVAGAQTPGSEAARATLEKVTVSRGNGLVSVEMTTRGATAPKVETLSSPDRIVIDLPNTMLAASGGRIAVGDNGVKSVRTGTDASAMTRVVVDLDRPCKYELVPGPGQKLTLKLGTPAEAAQAAPAPSKAMAAVAAAPATAPVQQEVAAASAKEFVVVDPTYSPKASADPAAKAGNAASKFVERPEGNLLSQASASMQSAPQAS